MYKLLLFDLYKYLPLPLLPPLFLEPETPVGYRRKGNLETESGTVLDSRDVDKGTKMTVSGPGLRKGDGQTTDPTLIGKTVIFSLVLRKKRETSPTTTRSLLSFVGDTLYPNTEGDPPPILGRVLLTRW